MSYVPNPIDTSSVKLPDSVSELTEKLAESNHDNWAKQRLGEGWCWGPSRDDLLKQHPGLVAYSELPEGEKEYDRITAMETLKAVYALGYEVVPAAGNFVAVTDAENTPASGSAASS